MIRSSKKSQHPFCQTVFLLLIGVFCDFMLMAYVQKHYGAQMAGKETIIAMICIGICLLVPFLFLVLRDIMHKILNHLSMSDTTRQRFIKHHVWTYLVFLGFGLVAAGIRPYFSFTLLLLLLFIAAQMLLLWWAADTSQRNKWLGSLDAVPVLFFVSGLAALIYQVVWQRVLFATFGTNIESVTVIVSVFMFGLGIGALAGGHLQKYFPSRILECFVLIELAIGVFGIFSIPLIHKVGEVAPQGSLIGLIGTTYALLAIPTMLMGATLPLLVTYLQKRYTTLGSVVGKLYAYNTFGSAFASFITVMLLFTVLGQQSTLLLAASCNVLTAVMAWVLCKRLPATVTAEAATEKKVAAQPFSPAMALGLSALVGYVSLSLEILWFRVIGYMTANMPQVFGVMLAIFLAGIAAGSLKAKAWSESGKDSRVFIFRAFAWMGIVTYFLVPLSAAMSSWLSIPAGQTVGYIAVGFVAYLSGGIFPLLCQTSMHAGEQGGKTVSRVYFINIVGATLGSLITGFVLLDLFPLSQNMVIICAVIIAAALIAQGKRTSYTYALGAAVCFMALFEPVLYKNVLSNLQGLPAPKYVKENRHGIITVLGDEKSGDIVLGNGAYDGRFNIEPNINANGITRVYMMSALHPHPQRVLQIGMSSASATKVLSMYKPIKELAVVEINPGYVDVVRNYPLIASALTHPKTKLHIDDGRRWLKQHPDEKFDMINMNSIYWWRSNATNLLSTEFLELCKKHLNPGGVLYYNTTGAEDSVYTVAHVFKHVAKIDSFVAASDTPFTLNYAKRKQNLLSFIDDNGKPVFADPAHRDLLEQLAKRPVEEARDAILARKDLWMITDDNMASEYKIDHSFLPPFK